MFRSWFAWFLLVVLVLPVSADSGPQARAEADSVLSRGVSVPLDGSPLAASLYRPPLPSSEGIVLLAGSDTESERSLWARTIDSLLDRGVSVLRIPGSVPLPVAVAGFRWFEAELGEDAVVGLGAEGGKAEPAWQLAHVVEPGATLLVEAHSEFSLPPFLLDPGRRESVLLLSLEDDFLARERARALFLSAPGRVELWLFDGEGMGWSGLLARTDVASDLAHWWLRSLEEARAARLVPVAERSEGGR